VKIHLLGTNMIPAGRLVDKQTERRTDGQADRRRDLTKLIFVFVILLTRLKILRF